MNTPTKEQALAALESLDDFARMANVDAYGPREVLRQYIEADKALMRQALEALRQAEKVIRLRRNQFASPTYDVWAEEVASNLCAIAERLEGRIRDV